MTPECTDSAGVIVSLAELVALRDKVLARRVAHPTVTMAAQSGGHVPGNLNRGMEYAESRPYRAGDDVRSIDWRQTARRGTPYTKLFHEEHERPVQLLVDLGPSMRFGTRVAFKSVAAARAAALLAWQASANGDRVGGMLCGAGHREVRPQSRHHGVLDLLHQLVEAANTPADTECTLHTSLSTLARTVRPGGMSVLVSDFHALDTELAHGISALAFRNDVALVLVHDPFESAPEPGLYPLTDGQRSTLLDLRSDAARAAHTAKFSARRDALEKLACHPRVRLLPLATDDDPRIALRLLNATP